MPITLFHVAFVWPLKMKFKELDFLSLTVGAMVPDLEPPFFWVLGIYPDRLLLHSLIGAVSVDLILTIVVIRLLAYVKLKKKIGITTSENNASMISYGKGITVMVVSAMIGSLSHVLADSLHHEHNPLLWPFASEPYLTSPLVSVLGIYLVHVIIYVIVATILMLVFKTILNKNGYGLSSLFINPIRAMKTVINTLSSETTKQSNST